MSKVFLALGVLCVVVAGVLLATGQGGPVAVVLLVLGAVAALFTVGGAAGS